MSDNVDRFNHVAQAYDTDRYPGRAQCIRKVLSLLDPQAEDRILDVGCGPGAQLLHLAPTIEYGCGIDPAVNMIQRAAHTAIDVPNLVFYVGDSERLPPEINRLGINKIFSNYALHHLSDEAKHRSIRNLGARLPVGGRFVLGDLMFSDSPDNHKDMFDVVGYGPGSDTPAHLSLLVEMFADAGLSPVAHTLNPLVAVIVGIKESS